MKPQIALLALLFFPCHLKAWEPFQTDVSQQAFPTSAALPDHLLPTKLTLKSPPFDEVVNYTYLARFTSRPSFTPGADLFVDRDHKTNIYRLYCSWSDPGVKETRTRVVEIPKALASTIYDVWANALLEVHYSRGGALGLDGTTYCFSTWVRGLGGLQGETWSPTEDLPPLWLVQAGDYLVEFARDERRDVKICERYFDELKSKQKHPIGTAIAYDLPEGMG